MRIEIACAADAAFMPHCAAMLHSVLSQHEPGRLRVHFLHDTELPEDDLQRLRDAVVRWSGDWRAHVIDSTRRARLPDNRRFGRVAWYRVFLPELLPEVSKVLYLDADAIVTRSLAPLWKVDLNGWAVGAVANPLYPFMDDRFLEELELTSQAAYFNSGVLLLNLPEWRRRNWTRHVLDWAARHGRQEWPDQNALNAVFRGRWRALPPEWNAQNTVFDLRSGRLPYDAAAIRRARRAPAVIHYIGPYKPWHYRCKHPLKKLYWEHLAQTPWRHMSMTGRTPKNRLLRLLPEQWGWRLESGWRALIAAMR